MPARFTSLVPLGNCDVSLAASCDAVARRFSHRMPAAWRAGLTTARTRARAVLWQAGLFVTFETYTAKHSSL